MRLFLCFLSGVVVASLHPEPSLAQYGPPITCPRAIAQADSAAPPDSVARAVRCAEWFIANQGFTDQAVADTAPIIRDFEESAFPRAAVLDMRRGSLVPKAYGACTALNGGYTVVFLYAGTAASDSVGRTVWMTRKLSDMYVIHQDIYLARVRAGEFGCRLLGSSSGRRQHN